jgi:hypothetical protein
MQTRSRTLEMPSGLSLPLAFGDIGFLDPGDQIVGDLLGGADDGRITTAEPHPADDAPQRPGLGK